MPSSETFDAFYARTVWNVTSQMHALAGEDNAADHAIREAYARAYQQWYQISELPDSEAWVLAVAKEAYQRWRPEAAATMRDQVRPGHDPLSMPGLFRPAAAGEPTGTGDTTLPPPAPSQEADHRSNWFRPMTGSAATAEAPGAGGTNRGRGMSGVFGGHTGAPGRATATAEIADDRVAETQHAGPSEPIQTGRPAGFQVGHRRPSAALIALVAAVAVVVAGVAYLVADGHPAGHTAGDVAGSHSRPAVHMLGAGKSGTRGAIPWSLVGPGWTLAEVSSAQPDADGGPAAGGSVTTDLVDPEGGTYQVQTSTGPAPTLLAWSGNAQSALLAVLPAAASASVSYDVLSLTTGDVSALTLQAGVSAVGFTRPDGLNILAVRQTTSAFRLQRYNLQGTFQATIGSLPRKNDITPDWQADTCGLSCGALSSPNGLYAVWGVTGDEMQLVSNAGGLIRRLTVPDSGSPPSCVPLSWWDQATVLAYCSTGQSSVGRLWLVPSNGSAPSPLTSASGSPAGVNVVTGAWQLAGLTYVTETNGSECAGAASGPGGLAVRRLTPDGSLQLVRLAGATGNHNAVVSASDGRLLVLAQTGCPGTSSLLSVDPATGATQPVLSPPAGQVGVLAALPFGAGPAAMSAG